MQASGPLRVIPPDRLKRLAWLLACIFAGLAVALVGDSISGSSTWYAAIPAAVAVGWLFFADPTQCEPPADTRARPCSRRASDDTARP